ncbi:hypothetical protein CIG75_06270 [Tumebacillus algifaecis]|uniref:DUF4097 domain-containing protein n=1 Tax=Tumebacillus algifaecis TaxID=1214604 RepID=A0A223CZ53_9BACL|nr:DUF4097 family beta strand repeat-containing protein [Tumebacillus algifaecis]ASS74611.1 hypothetical protein CIG75_06270 [Tumebacillus algifaecis]
MLDFLLGTRAKFEGSTEVTLKPDELADQLKVLVHSGNIIVKHTEQETVQAHVHVVIKGELAEEIRTISDADRLWRLEQDGNSIVFEQREFSGFYTNSSIKISVELTVPKQLKRANLQSRNGTIEARDFWGSVDAHTRNGSVDVRRIAGDVSIQSHNGSLQLHSIDAQVVRAETHHGSIALDSVYGDVDLDTRNGSVETKNIEGALRLQSRNGSLRIEKVTGDLMAETHNGKIVVSDCERGIDLHTHNGSVRVQNKTGVGGNWQVTTHNGSIELNIPKDTNATFTLKTSAGKVHGNAIPVQTQGLAQNIAVKRGDGEHVVKVETHRGSIEVSELKR